MQWYQKSAEKTLQELAAVLGEERRVSLCRELTKVHETVLRETLGEALRRYGADAEEPRGEYVLVIEGRSREAVQAEKQAVWQEMTIAEHVRFYMAQGLDQKEAMKQAARDRGCGKRDIYAAVLRSGDPNC